MGGEELRRNLSLSIMDPTSKAGLGGLRNKVVDYQQKDISPLDAEHWLKFNEVKGRNN